MTIRSIAHHENAHVVNSYVFALNQSIQLELFTASVCADSVRHRYAQRNMQNWVWRVGPTQRKKDPERRP